MQKYYFSKEIKILKNNTIEEKYTAFFSQIVNLFFILMISTFIFNIAETALDKNKTAEALEIAISGGRAASSVSEKLVIVSVKLLAGSLIVSFTYLFILFFRGREYFYSIITAILIIVFLISAFYLF